MQTGGPNGPRPIAPPGLPYCSAYCSAYCSVGLALLLRQLALLLRGLGLISGAFILLSPVAALGRSNTVTSISPRGPLRCYLLLAGRFTARGGHPLGAAKAKPGQPNLQGRKAEANELISAIDPIESPTVSACQDSREVEYPHQPHAPLS